MNVLAVVLAAIFIVPGAIVGWLITQAARDRRQHTFASGKVPDSPPDGLYTGRVFGLETVTGSYVGKRFDAAQSWGINVFKKETGQREAGAFRTSSRPGLQAQTHPVLPLDYDVAGNPAWVRQFYIAELVETGSGQYLARGYLRIPLLNPCVLFYVELRPEQ
jgi:hypothetical protein